MATRSKSIATKPLTDGAIGRSGLKQSGGHVYEEPLAELRGLTGATTYRQMADMDDTIGGIVFAVTMLLRSVKWSVTPKQDDGESQEAADFLQSIIDDMDTPMSGVIDEACSMFVYGYAPMEIVYKRRDGKGSKLDDNMIGVRSIALRAQTSITEWIFDPETDDLLGLVQMPPNGGGQIAIPIERMLLFRTTATRSNPEGRSLLRNAYRSWIFKKRIQEIEGVGIERDLAGLPVAYIPAHYFDANADADTKAGFAAWKAMVSSIRRDQSEGVVMPSIRDQSGNLLYDLKLLSTGGGRTFDTSTIVGRYDRGMATSVLADFIFLGQQAVGSFALSSDKTALFAAAIGGFKDSIEDILNRFLVDRIWRLNGLDDDVRPTLKAGDIEQGNLAEASQLLTAMAGAGAMLFPDRRLEDHLRTQAGWPEAPEEGAGPIDELARMGLGPDGMPLPDPNADPAAQQPGGKPQGGPKSGDGGPAGGKEGEDPEDDGAPAQR
ncbi:MAG: hypothetical protein KA761_00390 [Gemmatimonadaceae bacterium]|nr:hypothetical protein [Gemmatimonadaceae bacterium]